MNMDPPDRREETLIAETDNYVAVQPPYGYLRVYNKDTKKQVLCATFTRQLPKEKLQKLAEWYQQGGCKEEDDNWCIEILKALA